MPQGQTRIFLDGGDPEETRVIKDILGFIDGQTTNPALMALNPEARARMERGEKFTREELLAFYRGVVQDVSSLVPADGSVSIEVEADKDTAADAMVEQALEMFKWIPNAHIKLPITRAGLEAANRLVPEGVRLNMTLCFSEEQAAAVFAATRGAERGQVFLSPFVGRLDDRQVSGMDLIRNIMGLYARAAGKSCHVGLLAASLRNIDHLLYCLWLGVDLVTVPFNVLKAWAEEGHPSPPKDYRYYGGDELYSIVPTSLSPSGYHWSQFNIWHALTDIGLAQFAEKWEELLK